MLITLNLRGKSFLFCKIVSNINSIYGPLYSVFVFESFIFFQSFNGIFSVATELKSALLAGNFSRRPLASLVLIYFYCLLTNHSFLFSEKFAFYFLLFASRFLVFALYLLKLHCSQPIRFNAFFQMYITSGK